MDVKLILIQNNQTCQNQLRNDCMHDNNMHDNHEYLMTLGYVKHSTRLIFSLPPSIVCEALYDMSCIRGQKRVVLHSTSQINYISRINFD